MFILCSEYWCRILSLSIDLCENIMSLREHVLAAKQRGKRIALVPTMGALHEGHIELVRQALEMKAHVIVSIFVNPLQFSPTEDLSKYPRTLEADRAKLIAVGADTIYLPSPQEMYPQGFNLSLTPGGVATIGLEDRVRPTHFSGVCTVVAKLFIQSQADYAFFGEKDYQQLKVVSHMARDLNMPIEIISCQTARENDGLAMSSRNVYLSQDERSKAPILYQTLNQIAVGIRAGVSIESQIQHGIERITQAGFSIDYCEARNANTLEPLTGEKNEPVRLLIAAKCGNTRLIDNIGV